MDLKSTGKYVERLWGKLRQVFFKEPEKTPAIVPFKSPPKKTMAVKARRRRNKIAGKSRRINRQEES